MRRSTLATHLPRHIVLLGCAVLVGVALEALPATPAHADHVSPPTVPSNIAAPAGAKPFLEGHAGGTQNYICLPSGSGFAWTLFGPQATLFKGNGAQLTTHFLSANPDEDGTPRATWHHSDDTSAVWAVAIASSSDPRFVAPGAIPWLRLQVVGREPGPTGGDQLLKTTFIQRLRTSGGIAPPAAACSQPAHVGARALVPYTADYIFLRGGVNN